MRTGRIAVVETNANAIDQSALAELAAGGFECEKLVLDRIKPQAVLADSHTLLIAHLSAPADFELAWMQQLLALDDSFPLILISGPEVLPSVGPLLENPSVSWLMAPCEAETLRDRATTAMRQASLRVLLAQASYERLHASQTLSVEDFLELALGNVAGALLDIRYLAGALAGGGRGRGVCHLFDCPRRLWLNEAIRDAIHTLEKTKSSFKSKELGALRHRLEAALKTASLAEE